ncbi:MAG: hypothetical protein U0R49_09850 [Fimbriimonadales bacterium]
MEKLHFVVFREGSTFVAQGLQHNIVTVGESLSEVKENIDAVVKAYREAGLVEGIERAPDEYWQRYVLAIQDSQYLEDHLNETKPEPEQFAHELQPAA